jgi:uncharacterized protein
MAEYETVRRARVGVRTAQVDEGLRTHMNKVYATMSVGTLVTFAVAWAVGSSPELLSVFRDPQTLRPNILGWIIMFAPLIMVFAMGGMVNRMSVSGLQTFFYAFSAVMGLSMAWIFQAFTGLSIAQVFLVTSISFAGLSLWGYTTKKDISGWGSFLIMGVIGLIVASIINIFLMSSALMFAVSVLGVLIFAGLTAYDTQRIKTDYLQMRGSYGDDVIGKTAIMGALSLYLNFINMFMMLLSLFGNRE